MNLSPLAPWPWMVSPDPLVPMGLTERAESTVLLVRPESQGPVVQQAQMAQKEARVTLAHKARSGLQEPIAALDRQDRTDRREIRVQRVQMEALEMLGQLDLQETWALQGSQAALATLETLGRQGRRANKVFRATQVQLALQVQPGL